MGNHGREAPLKREGQGGPTLGQDSPASREAPFPARAPVHPGAGEQEEEGQGTPGCASLPGDHVMGQGGR